MTFINDFHRAERLRERQRKGRAVEAGLVAALLLIAAFGIPAAIKADKRVMLATQECCR